MYDFAEPPIIFDNGHPYQTNITEYTDSTAWIKFYNFLYEEQGKPTNLKLQYQYQYTMNYETGEKVIGSTSVSLLVLEKQPDGSR